MGNEEGCCSSTVSEAALRCGLPSGQLSDAGCLGDADTKAWSNWRLVILITKMMVHEFVVYIISTKGIATRSKDATRGIATRSKDATRGSWPYY